MPVYGATLLSLQMREILRPGSFSIIMVTNQQCGHSCYHDCATCTLYEFSVRTTRLRQ